MIYRQGRITIAQNSNTVQGAGTRWLTYITAGDELTVNDETIEIESVDDFNKLTLVSDYLGADVVESAYQIERINTLLRAKLNKRDEILKDYVIAVDLASGDMDSNEAITIVKQESEAIAYLADNNTSVPFLEYLADEIGITVTQVANIVITRAENFDIAMAKAIGRKQFLIKTIKNATTIEEVDAITYAKST